VDDPAQHEQRSIRSHDMSRRTVRVTAALQASPADKWISRAAAATVIALAGLAGAISYSHMRQLAQEHGQAAVGSMHCACPVARLVFRQARNS
jgi:hypothetical protein